MNKKYEKLFERISINGMDLKNRIAMAPMGTFTENEDGTMSEKALRYYEERAKGGAGLIISEIQWVSNKNEAWLAPQIACDTNMQTKSWYYLAERVHAHGAKLCIQLSLGLGKNAFIYDDGDSEIKSASDVPMFYRPDKKCTPMTREEIKEAVKAFGRAAQRVVYAEADAIEIHAHVGYLLDQFLSAQWNTRTDEYGGSFENRMRFITEIYEEIRRVVGPNFPIFVRMALDHQYEGGRTAEEGIRIAKYLESLGVDALDIDLGAYEHRKWLFPTHFAGTGSMVHAAAMVKEAVNIPVLNAGNHTPDSAVKAIEEGKIDIALMGRPLIADPEIPNKIFEDRLEDIRPCLFCNQCSGRSWNGLYVRCATNTQATAEGQFDLTKVENPKNVVVVGGGPGGMEAARVAAARGHNVTLYEKAPVLGGQLIPASAPSFKFRIGEFMKYQITQLEKTGVKVVLNTTIDENSPELENADAIIVAAGASPLIPPIKGIDGANVVEVTESHAHTELVKGNKIVIAGGGLSGCDAGIELAMEGKDVTVVEMQKVIAPDVTKIDNRNWLLDTMEQHNVKAMPGHRITEINEKGVVAVDAEGNEKLIEADTVISAFGMRPNSDLANRICKKYNSIVTVVGDCKKILAIEGAVRGGFFAGWAIK